MTSNVVLKVILAKREEPEEVAVESVQGLGPGMALLFMSTFYWLELSHMALRGRLGNVVELVSKKRGKYGFQ